MKIALMGSEGLIGKHLFTKLQRPWYTEPGHDVDRYDIALGHDLTDEDTVTNIFASEDYDAIINCFAWNDHVRPGEKRGTILEQSYEDFKDCMDVNVAAMFLVCREYAKSRIARGCGGNIINFGASTGIVTARTDLYMGMHKNCGYSTSKAAVIHMTRILATHLGQLDHAFRVNCISPGGIEHDQPKEFQELYGQHTPLGRMCQRQDLMPAVKMLLSEDNKYMTGANIVIDGGWTIQ